MQMTKTSHIIESLILYKHVFLNEKGKESKMADTSGSSNESEYDSESYFGDTSMDMEDEVDEDFYKTVENILDKIFDIYGLSPNNIATNPSKITAK